MQLIFYGDFRKLFTPESRCKHEGFLQAIPGEIRPQTCTKLAKLAPVIYINLQKYAKVCTRYIYIIISLAVTEEINEFCPNRAGPKVFVPTKN